MIKGYACRSKKSDGVMLAAPTEAPPGNFKTPDIDKETGWFWHIPGWFYTMPIWTFKKTFGFSIKPGTYKLINISISER